MNRYMGLALCASLGLTSMGGALQPAGEPPSSPGDRPAQRGAGEQPPADREAMKALLTRRLEEQRRRQEMFERALNALEQGADPAKVRSELEAGGGGRRGLGAPSDRRADRIADGDDPIPPRDLGPLTPEEREETLSFLEEIAPRMGARIRQFLAERPEMATRILGRLRAKLADLRSLREHDPELFQLKVAEMQGAYAVMEVARRLREASGPGAPPEEVRRARAELKEAIGLHFDHQVAVQQHEVRRLTERLERLQAQIKDRRQGRERAIERQVEDVMNRSASEVPGERRKNRPPPE